MESARILVAGLLNVETSVRLDGFPVPYLPEDYPVDAVKTAALGVALNLPCSLAAFVHHWLHGDEPAEALRKAMVFASWKIGESGGAKGFPDAETYSRLVGGL